MENRKDIGKAYKEKLEGYESSPGNHLWESIEAELNKSKRKAFPVWKTLVGLGVLILLLFSIIIYNVNSTSQVFETNSVTNDNILKANEEDKDNVSRNVGAPIQNKTNDNEGNSTTVSTSTKDTSKPISNEKPIIKISNGNSHNITSHTKNSEYWISSKVNSSNNKDKSSHIMNELEDETISNINRNNDDSSRSTSGELKTNNDLTNQKTISKFINILDDVMTFEMFPIVIKDDLISARLDNLLFNEDKKQKSSGFKRSLRLSAYLSPTFSKASSGKSSIDHTLDNAKQTSGFDLNYGIALTASLSKKSSLRVSVGTFNQSTITEDADSIDSDGLLISSPSFSNINLNTDGTINAASEVFATSSMLDLEQTVRYLETSIDYSYEIFDDKKLSLYASSGIGALILLDDSIILKDSDGNSLDIGKANNLNKAGLALNLGIGLSYKLSKRLNINTEPFFKYHPGTFKNTSNITHYGLGVRFGLSLKL